MAHVRTEKEDALVETNLVDPPLRSHRRGVRIGVVAVAVQPLSGDIARPPWRTPRRWPAIPIQPVRVFQGQRGPFSRCLTAADLLKGEQWSRRLLLLRFHPWIRPSSDCHGVRWHDATSRRKAMAAGRVDKPHRGSRCDQRSQGDSFEDGDPAAAGLGRQEAIEKVLAGGKGMAALPDQH